MSLGKRYLDELNQQQSPAFCPDCRADYDLKGYVYCQKHAQEAEEFEANYAQQMMLAEMEEQEEI